MSAFLFIDNLLESYETFLVDSYIGSQGRISVQSANKEMLEELKVFSKQKKFDFSKRTEYKANVVFLSPSQSITKYAKFVILDKEYIRIKFKQNALQSHTLFLNEVFVKSMGTQALDSFTSIYYDDPKNIHSISKFIVTDTGFLGNEPIVYIDKIFAKELFGSIDKKFTRVEFLEQNKVNIASIKKKVEQLAKKHKVLEVQIFDLLLDTKSAKAFFEKVKLIQFGITLLIFLLAIGVIVVSVSVSIEFKYSSLKILNLVGMSRQTLSLTLGFTILMMSIFILLLSVAVQSVYQKLFLDISGFSNSFFVAIDSESIMYITLLSLCLGIVTSVSTTIIFRGNR